MQKAIRPATLRGSEQAENHNLALEQIEVLNNKSALKLQSLSMSLYVIDGYCIVVHAVFGPQSKERHTP